MSKYKKNSYNELKLWFKIICLNQMKQVSIHKTKKNDKCLSKIFQ